MATIQIKPITTTSIRGHAVTIDGIDPTDSDCLHGSVTTPGLGTVPGRWDLNGTMRGGLPDFNLDMQDDDAADAAETARRLGAP